MPPSSSSIKRTASAAPPAQAEEPAAAAATPAADLSGLDALDSKIQHALSNSCGSAAAGPLPPAPPPPAAKAAAAPPRRSVVMMDDFDEDDEDAPVPPRQPPSVQRPSAGGSKKRPAAGPAGQPQQQPAVANKKAKLAVAASTPNLQTQAETETERNNLIDLMQRYSEAFGGITHIPHDVGPNSSLDELKLAYAKMQREVTASEQLYTLRKGLVSLCGVAEGLSCHIPGQPIKLGGLQANVEASIKQFDVCLKQLAFKHFASITNVLTPEMTLIIMVGNIAMQTHMMNRMLAHTRPGPSGGGV